MLEALVRVGAGDDFRAGAAYIHIPLVMHNVTGITLQPINYKAESRYLFLSELWRILIIILKKAAYCIPKLSKFKVNVQKYLFSMISPPLWLQIKHG